jgi:hypothetical protein
LDDGGPGRRVLLDEGALAFERHTDGSELDLHATFEGVAVDGRDGGTGQAGGDALDVGEHRPRLLR